MLVISPLLLSFLTFSAIRYVLCYAPGLGSDVPSAGTACSSRSHSNSQANSNSIRIPFALEQEYRLSLTEDGGVDVSSPQSLYTITASSASGRSVQDPLTPPPTPVTLSARPTSVWRPRDPMQLQRARLRSLRHGESEPVQWDRVELLGPDVEDKHTLGQLARMSGNAYSVPGQKSWYDLDTLWNTVRLRLAPVSAQRDLLRLDSAFFNDDPNLCVFLSFCAARAFRSAGKTPQTGSAGTSSSRRTTGRSC